MNNSEKIHQNIILSEIKENRLELGPLQALLKLLIKLFDEIYEFINY